VICKERVIIIGKKEFVGQISPAHQSTGRTCTGPASSKLIIISITLKQSGGQNMNTSIKYSQAYCDNNSMHEQSTMNA
jgi:hypothetical protein